MKKKVLALVLSAAMVFGLAACGNKDSGNTSTDSQTQQESTPGSSGEEPSNDVVETRPNRFIYGTTTQMNGDIGVGAWWSNNASDALVRALINDYSTVQQTRDADWAVNASVVDGDIESVVNEDATKTITTKIKQGLVWNNGDPITAADYVAYFLVAYSSAAQEAQAGFVSDMIVGAPEYQNGETNVLTGVRLLDEYTFSFTLTVDYADYYYELLNASASPLHLASFAPSSTPTVKDDGEGAYLDGGELKAEEIDACRWNYDKPVSAGPYTLTGLDMASYTATLEINPNYAGNYEGQKPSIQQLVIKYTPQDTQFDDLVTGGVDMLDRLGDGGEINQALDLVEGGGYDYVSFPRSGYGGLVFVCDGGPTQFAAVRHAIAYLLDRNEFANTFTGGFGSVVNGPYGDAQWQYQESAELFATELNSYAYSPETAVQVLEEDGWVLNADGTDYSGDGVRYKEVTAEEAGTFDLCVTLDDGRILMPLHIYWCSSENNTVSDLLVTMLANGQQTADAGMKIQQDVMSFNELLNYMYRDDSVDAKYAGYHYGMFNLGFSIYLQYDYSFNWTLDPVYLSYGYNTNFLLDERMDQISMDMVYAISPDDREGYLAKWQEYIIYWNELLPDLPLYSNIYHTVYRDWLLDYDSDDYFSFQYAILYASIENAE